MENDETFANFLSPGNFIALSGSKCGNIVSVNVDGIVGFLSIQLPLSHWRTWERFKVLDAGGDKGEIFLFCLEHNLLLRVDGTTSAYSECDQHLLVMEKYKYQIRYNKNNGAVSCCFFNISEERNLKIKDEESFLVYNHPFMTPNEFDRGDDLIPQHLIDELRSGNVIAFLGAGFTLPAGLPDWVGLLRKVKEQFMDLKPSIKVEIDRLIKRGTSDALDQAAQMLEDVCGKEVFYTTVANILTPQNPLPDEMKQRLKCLKEIPFKAIVTTNVDTVVPGSISNFDPAAASIRTNILRSPQKHFYEQLLVCSSPNDVPVLQLHGSVSDPTSMVLTRKGYRRLLHGDEGYVHFIRSLMAQSTILYLGFSFSDYYLNETRSSVLNMLHLDETKPFSYAISFEKSKEESEFFLKHEGTHFINYETSHSRFNEILDRIRNWTSPLARFGRGVSGKRILWNEWIPQSIERWHRLVDFMEKCVAETGGATCTVEFTCTANDALEKIKSKSKADKFDLVITAFGEERGDAYIILKGIKDLQLQQMEITQASSLSTESSHENSKAVYSPSWIDTDLPAVIALGMDCERERRKNLLIRLGALDYCGFSGFNLKNELDVHEINLLSALYRAFSTQLVI